LAIAKVINMRHVYGLKYANYDVNEMDIKILHILLGLNGHAGSNGQSFPFCLKFLYLLTPRA